MTMGPQEQWSSILCHYLCLLLCILPGRTQGTLGEAINLASWWAPSSTCPPATAPTRHRQCGPYQGYAGPCGDGQTWGERLRRAPIPSIP